jgi:hypothetical protein
LKKSYLNITKISLKKNLQHPSYITKVKPLII